MKKIKTWIIFPEQKSSYILTAVNLEVCLVINIFSPDKMLLVLDAI